MPRRTGARAALKQMCDLFALTEIEREKGFYQEHGRLSGPRCKAISRQVGELCDRVRAQAGGLRRRLRDP